MINKNALFSLAYLKNEVDLLYALGQLLFFSAIKQIIVKCLLVG